ncbi:hypothetical protein WJX73_008297 [Symbiochloris irregularis]|uniref:Uncharacterized protein n=1 Tax=Symbiochloris irregularis TaxID=706552 RepID=A0AAW1NWP9_9CHLO
MQRTLSSQYRRLGTSSFHSQAKLPTQQSSCLATRRSDGKGSTFGSAVPASIWTQPTAPSLRCRMDLTMMLGISRLHQSLESQSGNKPVLSEKLIAHAKQQAHLARWRGLEPGVVLTPEEEELFVKNSLITQAWVPKAALLQVPLDELRQLCQRRGLSYSVRIQGVTEIEAGQQQPDAEAGIMLTPEELWKLSWKMVGDDASHWQSRADLLSCARKELEQLCLNRGLRYKSGTRQKLTDSLIAWEQDPTTSVDTIKWRNDGWHGVRPRIRLMRYF